MPDWLARRAALSPEALALAVDGERITFAELERRAQAAAAGLARLGVGPGDRVAVLAAAGWPYVALLFGAIRRRAILVPLNTRLAPAEIAWQLDDAGAGWLLYDETTVERAHAAAAGSAGVRRLPLTEALAGEPTTGAVPPIELARLHAIVYTSGTTGRPKGAMLTYGNHWWSAIASMLNLGLRADDRWLICLPLFHVGGMSILFRSVIGGFGSVLHASFQPDAVNRAIDEGVTIVSVVSVMLSRMLAARSGRPYPAWFRCALTGGGPVPAELLEACVRAAIPVAQTYG
ncbi:MAG TPA: AMP-binding protein, partial [Limnochordia bacterium]